MKTTTISSLNDTQLIRHVLEGELDYFELLMRRNNPYLYRIGRAYGFSHEDVEDLMQESHVNAYRNLATFEGRSSYKTWLTRIMIHQCYQKKKKKSHYNERTTMEKINGSESPVFHDRMNSDTEEVVNRKELSKVVESALEILPDEFREVIVLKELNGMSVADTATTLNITESNVKVRLHRARKMMRERIELMYRPEDIFEFNLVYCDAIVNRVMGIIRQVR